MKLLKYLFPKLHSELEVLRRQRDQLDADFIELKKRHDELISTNNSLDQSKNGEFVPWGHYYSCIPTQEAREKFAANFDVLASRATLPGINLPEKNILAHLESMAIDIQGCPFTDTSQSGFRYYFQNDWYSYGDAISLYSTILKYKPNRIVEVGSGFSSSLMLDMNEHLLSNKIDFTFIEPYPERLLSLLSEKDKIKNKIICDKVQNVELSVFKQLQAGDILFIDSTHVSKIGSDVNFLYFEVLPLLNKGVNIHIHDIFWPFEYPAAWVAEGRCWNEAYILRAMLIHTQKFEILYASDYALRKHYEWIEKNASLILKNPGGHIWLRVV